MQANTPRCEHERMRMQGSFFSNVAVFFLLFLIARTRTRSLSIGRFSHEQSHILDLEAYKITHESFESQELI